ncbi:hypothetical protein ABZ990_15070 [Streptomyces sp. NPDC046203]|uniref:hypothetical protein n=1 Tax=Streptomyces sp. NPDC046203 TaxID=3154602 RepID=UPI0033D6EE6A
MNPDAAPDATPAAPARPRTPSRLRLDRALDRIDLVFRGMTARADEVQCVCHWGDADELALLKIPDVPLAPDLLFRTWRASDWDDHGAVLRRVLPQFARQLADGLVPDCLMDEAGRSFGRGRWQRWPAPQRAAVREFLRAWWTDLLDTPDPTVPAHAALVLCFEASGTLGPWLDIWEARDHPVAGRHLAEAAARWEYDLLRENTLPWRVWNTDPEVDPDSEALRDELTAWLLRHAVPRLRALEGVPESVPRRIRLLGLTGPARWEHPDWQALPSLHHD